eukprot:CAMPEP_0194497874 /NCGR_PEP_ID=MMETSP0253-20130528/14684_1 /TAXON_ID=2966 /ORGANISM="Noctiluca scintillans" /LENGTH=180 /DNA_ID=CAMNT_0039339435 /DNA_START=35 /DNA_END=577 /DNA_ORIENTATION=+
MNIISSLMRPTQQKVESLVPGAEEAGVSFNMDTILSKLFATKPKTDYLEIDGVSVPCMSATWNKSLLPQGHVSGVICPLAPLMFDEYNSTGKGVWGQAGRGCIVVVYRGEESFETITRNAEASGAVGVVVINNSEDSRKRIKIVPQDKARPPPRIPAVCVSRSLGPVLTAGCIMGSLMRK